MAATSGALFPMLAWLCEMKFPKITKKQGDKEGEPRAQYAALPWRLGERVEILLVTSRDTHRWVIPKGWPMKGRSPRGAAAVEASEEAGLLGKIEMTLPLKIVPQG
jgi:8-oxo-dGTP pyrophosphatase MutT (NUDIX family)